MRMGFTRCSPIRASRIGKVGAVLTTDPAATVMVWLCSHAETSYRRLAILERQNPVGGTLPAHEGQDCDENRRRKHFVCRLLTRGGFLGQIVLCDGSAEALGTELMNEKLRNSCIFICIVPVRMRSHILDMSTHS